MVYPSLWIFICNLKTGNILQSKTILISRVCLWASYQLSLHLMRPTQCTVVAFPSVFNFYHFVKIQNRYFNFRCFLHPKYMKGKMNLTSLEQLWKRNTIPILCLHRHKPGLISKRSLPLTNFQLFRKLLQSFWCY